MDRNGAMGERARNAMPSAGWTVFAACLVIVLLFWIGEKLVLNPLARRYQRN